LQPLFLQGSLSGLAASGGEMTEYPWNFWYPILSASEVKKNRQIRIKRFGQYFVLWRNSENRLSCLEDQCPHRGASLAQGKLVDDQLVCPYHGIKFNHVGKCTHIPSNGKTAQIPRNFCAKHYLVKEQHGFVWLWWGDKEKATQTIDWFNQLSDDVPSFAGSFTIPLSFCRWFEGAAFDVSHLGAVHKKVLPKNAGPKIDKFKYQVTGNLIQFECVCQPDPSPQKGQGMPLGGKIIFPATFLHEFRHASSMQAVSVNAPIDDEHTWAALKYYYHAKHFKLLAKVGCWFMFYFCKYFIMPDDVKIQINQLPKDGGFQSDQLVANGDSILAVFWSMWRKNLKDDSRIGQSLKKILKSSSVPLAKGDEASEDAFASSLTSKSLKRQ
jgi:phenylpropionate dioxygenase-like ring-hydroxylating dioxygenase large terminal subunit